MPYEERRKTQKVTTQHCTKKSALYQQMWTLQYSLAVVITQTRI